MTGWSLSATFSISTYPVFSFRFSLKHKNEKLHKITYQLVNQDYNPKNIANKKSHSDQD